MKINALLNVFAPKDTKFFPLLRETGVILVESATLLERLLTAPSEEERAELGRQIKAAEVKGDKVTGKIFKALNNTFITPFDREDIHALADTMDDTIDAINRSAQKVILYAPRRLSECTVQLAGIVKQSCLKVQACIEELDKLRKTDSRIRVYCKEIKKLEEAADVVYETGIMTLFKEETVVSELIKLKEITQELETSSNQVNNIGKTLKTILVKYA